MKPHERIIVALDTQDFNQCRKWVRALKGSVGMFKIGSELFTSVGRKGVDFVLDNGGEVFLDLKFHDIPNTVAQSARAAAQMGVKMFNVHAIGGTAMMAAAKQAVKEAGSRSWLLAVTILTSMGEKEVKDELSISMPLQKKVLHLAGLAKKSGLDGVVASAKEVAMLKKNLGKAFKVITPGIRPSWSVKGDQTRVVTPADAVRLGSDYMVIGRPITGAADPKEAVEKIVEEITRAS